MKWVLKKPSYGDMIRVKLGSIYHFGIFVSQSEIIQFGLAPSARPKVRDCDVEVCSSDLDVFLNGGIVEVGEPEPSELSKLRSPDAIVSQARSRLGEKRYSIIYNNCEHFAYECVLGEKYSSQTDFVRNLFRSVPVTDVYVASIPTDSAIGSVLPAERNTEILSCKNKTVQREKYYVWKLLEYALNRTFGLNMEKVSFQKSDTGKWKCDSCEFSLSHSKNAVAVAISRKPIGVDIQLLQPFHNPDGIANRILSQEELEAYHTASEESKTEYLLKKWTEKESIFKSMDAPGFLSADPKSFSQASQTRLIQIGTETYSLSVASEVMERLRFYENIDLTKF